MGKDIDAFRDKKEIQWGSDENKTREEKHKQALVQKTMQKATQKKDAWLEKCKKCNIVGCKIHFIETQNVEQPATSAYPNQEELKLREKNDEEMRRRIEADRLHREKLDEERRIERRKEQEENDRRENERREKETMERRMREEEERRNHDR